MARKIRKAALLGTVVIFALALPAQAAPTGFAPDPVGEFSSTCFGKTATILGAGSLIGTPGDDIIIGSDKADVIDGGDGNDLICSKGGDDEVQGGNGNDQIKGGSGNDTLRGGFGIDWIYGEAGHDSVVLGMGLDFGSGGPGDDYLNTEDGFQDKASGDSGWDTCRMDKLLLNGLLGSDSVDCETVYTN